MEEKHCCAEKTISNVFAELGRLSSYDQMYWYDHVDYWEFTKDSMTFTLGGGQRIHCIFRGPYQIETNDNQGTIKGEFREWKDLYGLEGERRTWQPLDENIPFTATFKHEKGQFLVIGSYAQKFLFQDRIIIESKAMSSIKPYVHSTGYYYGHELGRREPYDDDYSYFAVGLEPEKVNGLKVRTVVS